MDTVSQPRLYNIESITNVKGTRSNQWLKMILNTEASEASLERRSYEIFSYNYVHNS